jgi:hypothetical protein
MQYNPKTKSFEITVDNLEIVYYSLIYSLKHIRKIANLPLDKYKMKEGPLSDVDHAQKGILDAALKIGIDMGAEWGNEMDLRS